MGFQWGRIAGRVSIDGLRILAREPIPVDGLDPRAFGAAMSMDDCATGARSRWTLKRVKCGMSYLGICDGLHADLDSHPTSSSFGGFVAGFRVFSNSSSGRTSRRLQGELRYSNRGAVALHGLMW